MPERAQHAGVAVVAHRGRGAQALGERGAAEAAQQREPAGPAAVREARGGEREQGRAQDRAVGLRRVRQPAGERRDGVRVADGRQRRLRRGDGVDERGDRAGLAAAHDHPSPSSQAASCAAASSPTMRAGRLAVTGSHRRGGLGVQGRQHGAVAHERAEVGEPREVQVADRVRHEQQHEVARRGDQRGEEREVRALRGVVVGSGRDLGGEPDHQRRLILVAALCGEPRGIGQQQPARLHHGAHHLVVERRRPAERVHEHVEPAMGAPVAHPHRVAMAHVDELELLEALDALAHRGHVHAERRGQRALRGQPLAGGVATRQDVGGEAVEDLVGERRPREFHCSEH